MGNRLTTPPPVTPTIQLNAPDTGTTLASGSLAAFSIAVGGASPASVMMYANDVFIGNAQGSGANWTFSWTVGVASTYAIVAKSFDAGGVALAVSAPVTVTVTGTSPATGSPSSAEPIPVNITLPTFGSGEAGTLPGSLNVGNDGAAGYSITW